MLTAGLLMLALALVLALAGLTLVAMGWSVVRPDRRIWPPQSCGPQTPVLVWGVTYALFGASIALDRDQPAASRVAGALITGLWLIAGLYLIVLFAQWRG